MLNHLRAKPGHGRGTALLLALLCAGTAHAAADCLEGAAEARATSVPGPRALTLDDGRIVRVAGIEPFDLMAPDAEDAEPALKQRLSELVAAKAVRLQTISDAPDRYGRIPAMVAADGALVQETLAREGLAIAFAGGDPLPCFDRILAAEAAARRDASGFWARRDGTNIPPAADAAALAPQIGRFAIVQGKILSVGNRAARTYLDFGTRWSQDVTVAIEARDRKRFGGEDALAALAGLKVRIRGYLREDGGPMMAVTSPMQLELLEAAGGEKPTGEKAAGEKKDTP